MTVAAYTHAIVIGTLKSRAEWYMEGGIENWEAESAEPGMGGGRVCGSLLGGILNRDGEGREK